MLNKSMISRETDHDHGTLNIINDHFGYKSIKIKYGFIYYCLSSNITHNNPIIQIYHSLVIKFLCLPFCLPPRYFLKTF